MHSLLKFEDKLQSTPLHSGPRIWNIRCREGIMIQCGWKMSSELSSTHRHCHFQSDSTQIVSKLYTTLQGNTMHSFCEI